MMYLIRNRLLVLALALFSALPAAAESLRDLTGAMNAAARRDWDGAALAAARSGPMAVALVDWQRLRAGQGIWPEYRDFARDHGDWPGMDLFYRRGEALLRPDLPAEEVIVWFGDRHPVTVTGLRALVAALDQRDPKTAETRLAHFWTVTPLTHDDEIVVLAEYGSRLSGTHDARIAAMLDQGEWAAAQRMIPLAGSDTAQVAEVRIALQSGRSGVDDLILGLPPALRDDPGLALDRFRWRVQARLGDPARELMLERSTSAEALRDPAAWASLRADYARWAMRAGNWALAERFAAGHHLPQDHRLYSDLEWLAGYAALRQGAADRAFGHFHRLESTGATPITLARALYWQARAEEAQDRPAEAEALYARAAGHQTAYYGQLAAERIGAAMLPALAVPGRAIDTLPDWRGAELTRNPVWQAAVWQIAAGYPDQGQRFLLHLSESAAPDDIARMARLMLELRMPWHALRLAKAAAARGAIHPAAYFPLTGLEDDHHGISPELVLSIARRESEFNHRVTSPAGAEGLMQVMPDTARMMANRIAEPYEPARLTTDPAYNARLGAAYLRGLQDRFGPSVALIASGYNAGPGRPARWLGDFGDLRRGADPVDWVELIPFDETRNYVMRVAESLPIYRARLTGRPAPIVPTYDLTGGGVLPMPPQPPIRLALSPRPQRSMMLSSSMIPVRAAIAGGVVEQVLRGEISEARAEPLRAGSLP